MAVFQWGGSIQFGAFVSIPVRVKAAVKTDGVSFQMLHGQCGQEGGGNGQAGYTQDWFCKGCGEKISRADTVKGWKGIPVDTDYLATLKADKSKVIELDGLVPADQIDPRYYEQSYDVTPEEGGEKAYVLLQKLLERSGRVAIGKAVLADREGIVTIRPRDGILALEVMYWPEDLTRAGRDQAARDRIKDVTISDAELAVGDQLVRLMARDFHPEEYKDVYAERVRAYLTTVEEGTARPAAPVAVAPKSGGLDLLAALQATIDAASVETADKAVEHVA
jgi:DNA end-binding protein Ku